MTEPRNIHRGTTQVLSAIIVLLGVAMIVSTIAHGGGALGRGILLGVLFIAAGLGRLYISARLGARRR